MRLIVLILFSLSVICVYAKPLGNKHRHAIDMADVTSTDIKDTTQWVELSGTVYGKLTTYMYRGKTITHRRQRLGHVRIEAQEKYATWTNSRGKFRLRVPQQYTDTLMVDHGCNVGPFGYSSKEIKLKAGSDKSKIKIELEYWDRPWYIICPCF